MDLLGLLNKLQISLKRGEALEVVWQHFYKLTESADVFSKSQNEPLPNLTNALSGVLVESFSETIPIREFVALRLQGSSFYHGISSARGLMMTYFYFKEIDIGVVAVPYPPLSTQIELRRFSINASYDSSTNLPRVLH